MHDAVASHEVKHANAVRAANRHTHTNCPNVKGQCEKNKIQEHIFPPHQALFPRCVHAWLCVCVAISHLSLPLSNNSFIFFLISELTWALNIENKWAEHTYVHPHLCFVLFCFYFLWVFHVTHDWSLMFSFHNKSPGTPSSSLWLFGNCDLNCAVEQSMN